MSPNNEQQILMILNRVEGKVDEQARELAEVKGKVIALDAAQRATLKVCATTHKRVDERLDDLEDTAEKTGEHDVQELRDQLAERKASSTHWSRWAIGLLVGAVFTLIVGIASGVTVAKITHQQTTSRAP